MAQWLDISRTPDFDPRAIQKEMFLKMDALGQLAYEDQVELAKLGSTVIQGGYLNTVLIAANSITGEKIATKSIEAKHYKNLYHPLSFHHVGNYDSSNPLTFEFYVSPRMQSVYDARINVKLSRYRRETRGASATTPSTVTSSSKTPSSVTSSSGGATTSTSAGSHRHQMFLIGAAISTPGPSRVWTTYASGGGTVSGSINIDDKINPLTYESAGSHNHSIGSHTHSVPGSSHNHDVPGSSHTHDVVDGITTSSVDPSGVSVTVNGSTVVSGLSGNGAQANNVGIASRIQTGWNTIVVSGANIGRAQLSGFVELILDT